MDLSRVGHPMAWIQSYNNEPVLIFHLFAPEEMLDQQIVENISRDMHRLGATLVELLDSRRWNFFPHVNPDHIRVDRFFDRMEAIQGENNTVFANEAITISTMPNSFEGGRLSARKLTEVGSL